MAQRHKSEKTFTSRNGLLAFRRIPPAYLPYAVLAGFFAFGVLLRPDLFWLLLTGLVLAACFIPLFFGSEALGSNRLRASKTRVLQNEAMRHAIIDGLQFPAYLIDQNARLKYANRSAGKTFGSIKTGDRITIQFRQPHLKKTIEEALTNQQVVTTLYNEPVPDDRWFQVEISPVQASAGNDRKNRNLYLLAFHDQTEARRIDQMRSDFIANASHELRTPLASLLGYIETIKGPAKNDTKARNRFTDVMLDQAQRMSRLVNDLLSLSQIEMKSHVKPSDTVSMREILRAVIASLEALARQMQVTIELEIDEDLVIIGDRDELIQVFENLVENACKYGQEGKRVTVSLERSDHGSMPAAIVKVRDYGIGIAAEHQQRITERFYRVDVARSREKQGTGLGLAIVKHILNRHDTKLVIRSDPGQGAEFSVRLRLANPSD